MNKHNTSKILINIYIILWCIYSLQGILYPNGGLLSRLVLVILLLSSLYCFVYANFKYKLHSVLKILSLIVLVFSIYGFLRIIQNEAIIIKEGSYNTINPWDYLKNIYISFLPVYTIYVGVKKEGLSEANLRRWTIVFLFVGIACFYWNNQLSLIASQMRGDLREEFTNNVAYDIIAVSILIPLFYKRPLWQYLILGVCLYYVLIGMKRGALLSGAVSTVWFLYYSIRNGSKKRKVLMLFLTTLVIIGIFITIDSLLQNSDWFNTRMEKTLEGDSSHRDELYMVYLNHFLNESDVFRFLFGYGADATMKIYMNYAHNDWLEIAINNGAVMVVLYFVYWVTLFRAARKAKGHTICFMILTMYFIINFLRSFFSMSYADVSIFASVALGYAIANFEDGVVNNQKNQTCSQD